MKRTKREQNGIVIHFLLYLVLTISISLFIFISIVPKIILIEQDKQVTSDIYEKIKRLEKKGLNFIEFKEYKKVIPEGYAGEVLKAMKKDFYDKFLLNTTNLSYQDFLSNIEKKVNSVDNKRAYNIKANQIANILPKYSGDEIVLEEDFLTTYKFINYIESLLESFNLKTTSSIGISNLILLDNYGSLGKEKQSIESDIYYIPLSLSLNGQKKGIIDFLYFIENVGNIYIKNNSIFIKNDFSFLSNNGVKKILESDEYSPDYNIFEQQIFDIERISISKYLDSSYRSRKQGIGFKEYVKATQGNEEFEINLNLRFYIKGQRLFEIKKSILKIVKKHGEALNTVNTLLKNKKINLVIRNRLIKSNVVLKQLGKEVSSIKKELGKGTKINIVYRKALRLDDKVTKILKTIKQ